MRATVPGRHVSIAEPEESFQAAIVDLAKRTGWMVHAERPARSEKGWRTPIQGHRGWPDVVLVRNDVLVIAELKSQRGRASPEQRLWLQALSAVPGVVVRCWKPSDWPEIEQMLKAPVSSPSVRLV